MGTDSWSDRIKRLQAEREYLQKHKSNTYNTISGDQIKKPHKRRADPNSIPIIGNQRNFDSINSAAAYYGVSYSTVRGALNNNNNTHWTYQNQNPRSATNVARPVVIKNLYYGSLSIAAAQINMSEDTAREKIKVQPDWKYFDTLTEKQKKAISNLDEKIKISSIGNYRQGRKVKVVGDQTYSSVSLAAKNYGLNRSSVYKRITSSKFPKWKWAEDDTSDS